MDEVVEALAALPAYEEPAQAMVLRLVGQGPPTPDQILAAQAEIQAVLKASYDDTRLVHQTVARLKDLDPVPPSTVPEGF